MWSGYTPESLDDRLQVLFESCAVTGLDEDYVEKDHWNSCGDFLEPYRAYEISKFEIILTRQERQRLKNSRRRDANEGELNIDEIMNYDSQSDKACSDIDSDNLRPVKRARLDGPAEESRPIVGHGGSHEEIQVNAEPSRHIKISREQSFEETQAHWSDHLHCSEEGIDNVPFSPGSYEQKDSAFQGDSCHQSPLDDSYQLLGDTIVDLGNVDFTATADDLTLAPDDYDHEAHGFSHGQKSPARESQPFSEPTYVSEIASRALGIAAFANLRAQKITGEILPDIGDAPGPEPEPKFCSPPRRRTALTEIFDKNTLQLQNDVFSYPTARHRYLVSLELLQKQVLVRALRSQECSIDLVERETLDGVDLILDPYSAVLFAPLFALPSQCDTLVGKVAQQSWLYSRLFVIFEAYPASHSYKTIEDKSSAPYAYTPPIMKAIKKFKRDISIAEACGTKRSDISVQYAFADCVLDAALYTRRFGDLVESLDQTEGAIWGDRGWLEEEFTEVYPISGSEHIPLTYRQDEDNLASLDGVNRFSAAIMLCQVSLQELLDLSPEARLEELGPYVGFDAIVSHSGLTPCIDTE